VACAHRADELAKQRRFAYAADAGEDDRITAPLKAIKQPLQVPISTEQHRSAVITQLEFSPEIAQILTPFHQNKVPLAMQAMNKDERCVSAAFRLSAPSGAQFSVVTGGAESTEILNCWPLASGEEPLPEALGRSFC
jgi:hypothetical protein